MSLSFTHLGELLNLTYIPRELIRLLFWSLFLSDRLQADRY